MNTIFNCDCGRNISPPPIIVSIPYSKFTIKLNNDLLNDLKREKSLWDKYNGRR